ncbi:MAG: phosphoribosylformylglycinamidine synthase, partial [Candidatus Latescibacteria bacterium]|nr:phosphoribosylformylglycinamidine synthase [Candidatus Latescibacterota bacterium]
FDCEFLHKGVPRLVRKATWERKRHPEPDFPCPGNLGEPLKKILSAWNVCSKEWIVRQYDHEVQAGSVVKPLTGASNDGPSDACVTRPKLGNDRGLVMSNGINPKYGVIDPYHMAMSVIDEALRQVTAVGGDISKTALLDNFAWGNTTIPDRLGDLVRAARGCYEGAVGFGAPFISGKDSLRNEFIYGDKVIRIPSTLLVSAMSVMDDVTKAVTMDFKRPGSAVMAVGLTKDEMGGSHYWDIHGFVGNSVPSVDVDTSKRTMLALHAAMDDRLIASCHDCSEGGIGVALAEMAFAGEVGVTVDLAAVPTETAMRDDHVLFSESNSRFIVEVESGLVERVAALLEGVPCAVIGETTASGRFVVRKGDATLADEDITDLKDAWQAPLKSM